VRTRYYRGLCQPNGNLDEAIAHMQSKREEVLALFENSKELEPKRKRKTLDFVQKFYDLLDDPKKVEEEIVARCRAQDELDEMLSRD